ncbi:hypothetical protein D3C77_796010 [compost metagenome]
MLLHAGALRQIAEHHSKSDLAMKWFLHQEQVLQESLLLEFLQPESAAIDEAVPAFSVHRSI